MSDPRIQAAIDHWAPRYVEHGVPVGDFLDVTRDISSWDEWCSAWSAAAAVHEAEGDTALAAGHTRSAALHFTTAAVEYHFAKFLFCHDMAQLRAAHEKAVAVHRKAHPHMDPPVERIEFPYLGTHTMVGNLRKPQGIDQPPVVVLMPGLDSAKEELTFMEPWFLERGMATFTIDGPGQGELEYDLPIECHYEKPVGAAIDALEARGDVDTDRLGALGVSLGGYYVIRASAFEKRIKALISLSGPFEIGSSLDNIPPMSQLAFITRTHSANLDEAKEHLKAMDLTEVVHLVDQPAFIVTGALDRLVPADQTRRIAEGVSGEVFLNVIPNANHVATNKAYLYRPHMADWMAERLST
jgi:dipeptidyl aminopeptidase/acylaminoacyl peptidase